jgi:IclR family transcriptional regulator, acetate operon repressor
MESMVSKKKRGRTPGPVSDSGAGQVQSLARGLTILERLAGAESGVALTDLAQRVGLSPSTTHRLLGTLEKMGFVHQAGDLGLWSIGVKAFIVGSAFVENRDLIAIAHPFLRRLMEQSGETTNLAILDSSEAVFLDQVQCHEMMRMLARLGSRAPLHASGVGKALLAAMADADVAEILHKRGLSRLTVNTIDTPEKLRVALRDIRRLGYAYDDEEHALGLRCLAASVYNEHSEPLAAVSIAGPKSRISDDRVAELGAIVARTARDITDAMGGRVSVPIRAQGA